MDRPRRAGVARFPGIALLASLALSLVSHRATAAAGQVRGRVLDPDKKPLPGVALVLANDVTGYRQQTTSADDGSYLFYNVPENPYHLTASLPGLAPKHAHAAVRGGLPVAKEILLPITGTAETQGNAEAAGGAPETDAPTTDIR